MIVCSCNVISDHEVREASSEELPGMSHVYRKLGRKPKCGHCKRSIRDIVRDTRDCATKGKSS